MPQLDGCLKANLKTVETFNFVKKLKKLPLNLKLCKS